MSSVTHCALASSQAVNAMLAALPEHLQGLPKGHKGTVAGSRPSRASMGPGLVTGMEEVGQRERQGQRGAEKDKGEGLCDGLLHTDENSSGKAAPVLRQSARVKQYASRAAVSGSVSVSRLAPILEDCTVLLSPDIYSDSNKGVSMAMVENPIARHRRLSLKPSFLPSGKDTTYVPNLLEDEQGGLESNAWMTI